MTKVYNLIILDESGSMASMKLGTISAFNELIQSIRASLKKNTELEQWLLFYTFNSSGIKERIPLQVVDHPLELDEDSYQPDNMTPLFDAIGHACNKLRYAIEKESEPKVLVTILTDGAENDSKEFTMTTIANMTTQLERQGWTFTYMGANQDSFKVAHSLNIKNASNWSFNEEGLKNMMLKENHARMRYYDRAVQKQENKVEPNYFDDDKKETD
ncbi:vWA domain-containing protein [Flavihumibacter sp.]|uniref:vWA domain-containing protein n=1 Tax=Flavihumibacter sp. TaxID=1913981 RepID=UPI002FC607C1